MPDLLTHVLFAYAFFRILSIRYQWLEREHITLGMIGAVLPDLSKLYLAVSSNWIGGVLGVPFDWYGIHTIGGVIVVALIVTMLVAPNHRRRTLILLLGGASIHLLLDAGIKEPTGHGYPALWPLTRYRLPTANLYTSNDQWPLVLALVLAGCVYTVWRVVIKQRANTP